MTKDNISRLGDDLTITIWQIKFIYNIAGTI